MVARALAVIAAIWAGAFAVVYVQLAGRPENTGVAWWYVGVVVVGAILSLLSLTVRARRAVLVAATVVFGIVLLLGLLSVGALILPAVVMTLIAALLRDPVAEAPGLDGGLTGFVRFTRSEETAC